MLRVLLLGALLLVAGMAALPEAAADHCHPFPHGMCDGSPLPDRCYYYPDDGRIVCEWD